MTDGLKTLPKMLKCPETPLWANPVGALRSLEEDLEDTAPEHKLWPRN